MVNKINPHLLSAKLFILKIDQSICDADEKNHTLNRSTHTNFKVGIATIHRNICSFANS
jgi:hypothetical protein